MKVLVVDDQALNRSLLDHMLKLEGYEVVLAENGQVAIEQCKKHNPDLVLLDVVMPVLDGYETAPLLKELSTEVYLPVIFITALGDQKSLERCLEVGGDDFLNKPFDSVILKAKINAHARIRDLSIKTFEQKKELDFYRLKTEREHQIVEHIFGRALQGNYHIPHLLESHLSPASMFNGDIMLVTLGPTGNLYVLMGDFTGHGLASAIGTLPISKTFYSSAKKGLSVGDIASELNDVLLTFLPDDMFCAASILELNNTGKSLSIWSGGTPDMYIVDDNLGVRQTLSAQHMALGILEIDEFEKNTENYSVSPTDRIVVATDGVVESFNENKEMFGYDRLYDLLNDPSQNSIANIVSNLTEFRGSAEQDDDISIISLRCAPVNSNQEHAASHFSNLSHSLQLTITHESIKNMQSDPVSEIIHMLSYLKGAEQHRSNLFLLLSEAYNNALDHGLLDLDSSIKDSEDGFMEYYMLRSERMASLESGKIDIAINYCPKLKSIVFKITDSGDGFDTTSTKLINSVNTEQQHGRGNALLQELADSVDFNATGNQITVKYCLNRTAGG